MKRWALAAVGLFALGAAAPADAADLPLYGKAPVVAPVLAFDWTGVYAGINGGGGLAHSCWSITAAGGVAIDPPVGEGCHNASGGTVGAQLGYRWQKGHWVLGAEAEGNWADFKGNNVSLIVPPINNRTKIDSFGLFTGQLGYTVNGLLFYGKTGAAVAHAKYDEFIPGVGVVSNNLTQTRWGYSAGFGVEYAFAENWSVGGEYDHLFLGHHGGDLASPSLLPPVRTEKFGQDVDIGLIRVSYRWGGPVVAKY
ncbi:outer membrane protein [Bradyrhizobium commune]|uniref:Porin family protein n=1 Tax=Bradyrhizobium commune TaxID=83627 RepID=A0A7S9DC04_9BRAD|nr:outer membrane beta-barrel protein [Bradyrhizobium commune]QPF94952.1 porin family protein [Bradyrhizobium commune]